VHPNARVSGDARVRAAGVAYPNGRIFSQVP
jgi:hypothetical protein